MRARGAEGRIEVVVVRPGILYGADLQPFIARLHLPVPRGKGRRIVVGSRSTLIPLTHVENACEAIALAASRGRPGASYNVIDGDVTQGQYLDLLKGGLDRRSAVERPFAVKGLEAPGKQRRRRKPRGKAPGAGKDNTSVRRRH